MNGHAHELLTKTMRVDGTSALVRVDTDDIIRAAAALCVTPLAIRHDQPAGGWRSAGRQVCGGVWAFERGQRVPGTGDTFGLARCTRCGARRDAVLPAATGRPLGGPVFPADDRTPVNCQT